MDEPSTVFVVGGILLCLAGAVVFMQWGESTSFRSVSTSCCRRSARLLWAMCRRSVMNRSVIKKIPTTNIPMSANV